MQRQLTLFMHSDDAMTYCRPLAPASGYQKILRSYCIWLECSTGEEWRYVNIGTNQVINDKGILANYHDSSSLDLFDNFFNDYPHFEKPTVTAVSEEDILYIFSALNSLNC
jgi:hypothetical protein